MVPLSFTLHITKLDLVVTHVILILYVGAVSQEEESNVDLICQHSVHEWAISSLIGAIIKPIKPDHFFGLVCSKANQRLVHHIKAVRTTSSRKSHQFQGEDYDGRREGNTLTKSLGWLTDALCATSNCTISKWPRKIASSKGVTPA